MSKGPSLLIIKSEKRLHKSQEGIKIDLDQKNFPIIATIKKNQFFILNRDISFNNNYDKYSGGYYYDPDQDRLLYGMIKGSFKYHSICAMTAKVGNSLYRELIDINYKYLLKKFNQYGENYKDIETTRFINNKFFITDIYVDNRKIGFHHKEGNTVNVITQSKKQKYSLVISKLNIFGKERNILEWIETNKLISYEEKRRLQQEQSLKGKRFFGYFILFIFLFGIIYLFTSSFLKKKYSLNR
jgi:hypothetical protein